MLEKNKLYTPATDIFPINVLINHIKSSTKGSKKFDLPIASHDPSACVNIHQRNERTMNNRIAISVPIAHQMRIFPTTCRQDKLLGSLFKFSIVLIGWIPTHCILGVNGFGPHGKGCWIEAIINK